MRRNKEDSLQTRTDLLHAALNVFDECGVAHASLAQIATAAGVTRGAVYWHFKNKEDLFDALCEKMLSELEQNLNQRGCHGTSWQNVAEEMMIFFQYLCENETCQKFFRVLYSKWEYIEENRAIRLTWEKHEALWNDHFRHLLEKADENNELPANLNITDAAAAIRAAQWGLCGSWLQLRNFDLLRVGRIVLTGVLKELQTSQ